MAGFKDGGELIVFTYSSMVSPGTRFPPTGNVDRVCWDSPLTDPSTEAVSRDQTRVIRWLLEAPLLKTLDSIRFELRTSQFSTISSCLVLFALNFSSISVKVSRKFFSNR